MAESNREEIAKLEALYANNPGGRVFTHLAEAYRKAGELDRARQILEDGITRHAEYASAHVVLGRVLQDQGAREEAAAAFRRVLDLDPENRVALRSLGDLARDAGQPEQALAYFRQLLALDPTDDQLVRTIDQLNAAIHAGPAVHETVVEEAASAETAPPAQPPVAPIEVEQTGSGLVESVAGSATAEPDFATASADYTSRTEALPIAEEGIEPAEFAAPEPLPAEPAGSGEDESPAAEQVYATPDISLDWDTGAGAEPDASALPGDLAIFAEAIEAPADDEAAPGDLVDIHPLTSGPTGLEAVESAAGEAGSEAGGVDGTAHEPTFEELLSSTRRSWAAQPEPESSDLHAELKTETLAELYLSQGFNDRAAEVYRSLLERNPGDERLRRRLEEVEARLAEAGTGAESGGEDAESVHPFWQEREASLEPTLYTWEPEADDPGGPTVREYFGRLLSWQRSATSAVVPGIIAVETGGAPSEFVEPAPAAKEGGEPATATEDVATAESGPGESAFVEVEAPRNTDAFVAQESAASTGSGLLSQFSAPLNEVEAAFEEWFSGTPAQAPSTPPATETDAVPAAAEAAPEPEPAISGPTPAASVSPAEAKPEAPGSSSEETEDDEDLEMFRSWLQSLKR